MPDNSEEAPLERRLGALVRRLRDEHPYASYDSANPFPAIYYEECLFEGRPYILPMVVLRTRPCYWFDQAGGCLTCGYQGVAQYHGTPASDILAQWRAAIEHFKTKQQIPFIHLTSSGSFFDPNEIPDDVFVTIAHDLETLGVRLFSTESRADVVSRGSRPALFREHFSGQVSVGIGIESYDPRIRNICTFKGLKQDAVESAIKALSDQGMGFHAYILVGKPFLTPSEDIEDCVATIRNTIAQGGDALLMVANLQQGSFVHHLWRAGLYKLPSLWAAIAVMRRLTVDERPKVAIKGFDKAVPQPEIFPQTCPLCTSVVRNALAGFNWTKQFEMLEQAWNCCACRPAWEQSLASSVDTRAIAERVTAALDELEAAVPPVAGRNSGRL